MSRVTNFSNVMTFQRNLLPLPLRIV